MTLVLEFCFQNPESKFLEVKIMESQNPEFKILEGLNPEFRNTESILNMHKS